MIASSQRKSRSAYTLLEMALALAIALVILGAIYEFLNQQIRMSEIGRDLVEENALARRILDRMASDIVCSLGGVDPEQLPSDSSGSEQETEALLLGSSSFSPRFNFGLEGNENTLIVYASRVPRELLAPDKRYADASSRETVCDLRRISYWYAEEGTASGLAHQELKAVSSSQFDTKPPDVDDVAACIVSEEVKGVMFEYFDGANWQSTWNGTDVGADGKTPLGPPSAIRITLTLQVRNAQGGTAQTREYRRTVALPAGNNFPAQQSGF
jgi:type II secretory pathway component PulJ